MQIMKNLIRRLSKVTDSSQYYLLRSDSTQKPVSRRFRPFKNGVGVPQGYLPVYVGDEMERFVVSAELLNHHVFVKLLNQSAHEYGYEQRGVLRIPCPVFVFERVLESLRIGTEARDLHELMNSLSDEIAGF